MFCRPASALEALRLREAYGGRFLGGGTDIFPAMAGTSAGSNLIDLTGCQDLKSIDVGPSHVRIGGAVTWSQLARAELPSGFRALQMAAREVGSIQIQNRATIGGNICNASPAADGMPPLLALDAAVELVGLGGVRTVPLSSFVLGNRRTAMAPDEMLVAIRTPSEMLGAGSSFRKLGARKYLVISIVMVSVSLVASQGRISAARVVVGAASAVARRLPAVEERLIGMTGSDLGRTDLLTESDFEDLSPIDDIRASASYRHAAARELVSRTLLDAWEAIPA